MEDPAKGIPSAGMQRAVLGASPLPRRGDGGSCLGRPPPGAGASSLGALGVQLRALSWSAGTVLGASSRGLGVPGAELGASERPRVLGDLVLPHQPTRAIPIPRISLNCPAAKPAGPGDQMSQERDLLLQRFQNMSLTQQTSGLAAGVELATKKPWIWDVSLCPLLLLCCKMHINIPYPAAPLKKHLISWEEAQHYSAFILHDEPLL